MLCHEHENALVLTWFQTVITFIIIIKTHLLSTLQCFLSVNQNAANLIVFMHTGFFKVNCVTPGEQDCCKQSPCTAIVVKISCSINIREIMEENNRLCHKLFMLWYMFFLAGEVVLFVVAGLGALLVVVVVSLLSVLVTCFLCKRLPKHSHDSTSSSTTTMRDKGPL